MRNDERMTKIKCQKSSAAPPYQAPDSFQTWCRPLWKLGFGNSFVIPHSDFVILWVLLNIYYYHFSIYPHNMTENYIKSLRTKWSNLTNARGDCFVALLLAMTLSDVRRDCFAPSGIAMTLKGFIMAIVIQSEWHQNMPKSDLSARPSTFLSP